MFIAHLPAGYISSTLLLRKLQGKTINPRAFILCGMFGAIAPDLDILYFYLIDHQQHNHHSYFTHYPFVWAILLGCSAIWAYRSRPAHSAMLALIFSMNGLLHMLLDTVVGGIRWGFPLTSHYFSFFTIPALHQPWWLNFILHWSFILELAILAGAFFFRHRPLHKRSGRPAEDKLSSKA